MASSLKGESSLFFPLQTKITQTEAQTEAANHFQVFWPVYLQDSVELKMFLSLLFLCLVSIFTVCIT